MPLTISIMTFLLALAVVLGIWLVASGEGKKDVIRKRLDAVRQAESRGSENPEELKIVRDEMLSTVPTLNRILLQWSWVGALKKLIQQAGMSIRPAQVLLLSGVLGIAGYLLAGYFDLGALSLAIGLAAALLPVAVIAIRRSRRLRKFEELFPDALDLLGRAVRAGHAFTTGLELIADESAQPVAGEFRQTFEEQNLGLPLRDSLLNLTERVPLVDVRMFVTALLLQKDTGGNLAEIMDELARIIRERFRIYREVKVKTAQGRLTAGILIVLPVIMLVALGSVNPSYVGLLLHDPTGHTMLLVAGAMQLLGSLMLWKVVHIDV